MLYYFLFFGSELPEIVSSKHPIISITIKNVFMYVIRLYIDYDNIIFKPNAELKILRP